MNFLSTDDRLIEYSLNLVQFSRYNSEIHLEEDPLLWKIDRKMCWIINTETQTSIGLFCVNLVYGFIIGQRRLSDGWNPPTGEI